MNTFVILRTAICFLSDDNKTLFDQEFVHAAGVLYQSFEKDIKNRYRNNEEKKIIDHILSRINALIKMRNKFVHGTLYIGWGNESTTDYSMATGFKLNKIKNSNEPQVENFEFTEDVLLQHIEETNELILLTNRLLGCVIGNYSMPENFIWEHKLLKVPK